MSWTDGTPADYEKGYNDALTSDWSSGSASGWDSAMNGNGSYIEGFNAGTDAQAAAQPRGGPSAVGEGWMAYDDPDAFLNDFLSTKGHKMAADDDSGNGGSTCSVCGASIERDPEGETNRTWHHNDGDKHDHEAQPSGGDKESRRRVARKTAATGSELRAQHSDLFSGADAAYDAEDSSWFESLSMDDLLILWDSVSGYNFIDMEGPWDDEVYEALADKGYEFPTKESSRGAAIDYPTDDDDAPPSDFEAGDFGGGDFPMQTPTSPPQSEQEGRGTLIDPNDAEYSPVTGQPGRYYTPDRDMTVGVGTRPGARRGLNDTGGGGGGSGLQDFPDDDRDELYSVQPNDPEPEQLEPSTDRPFEEGGYLAPVADYLNKFRQVPASKRTAADDESSEGGQTCSVCGASIERDPPGEDPRTWHHNDGESHDHEAKPGGGDKESRRRAAKGTYDEWMAKVDAAVQDKAGLSVHDLEDCPFMDWYDDGVSPSSAAGKAIRNSREGRRRTAANPFAKTRPADNPYEIWTSADGSWEWHVLKKWQVDDSKPYGRWFCLVKTPYVPGGEMGDVYVDEVKANATRTYVDPSIVASARKQAATAKGTQFKVIKAFHSSDLTPTGPYAWQPSGYVFQVGDILTYEDFVQGWGSDPAFDDVVIGADGLRHRIMAGWSSPSYYLKPQNGYVELVGGNTAARTAGAAYDAGLRDGKRGDGIQYNPYPIFGDDAAEWIRGYRDAQNLQPGEKASMRKGAPFADYKDFADCVAKNGDKDDPEAYCGKIKHQVEDSKSAAIESDPQPPKITPNPDGPKTVMNGWIRIKGKDEPEYNPEVAQSLVDMAHWDRLTFQDMNLGSRTATGPGDYKTEGAFKVQVAGSGENVWVSNALRFDTQEEAKAYASDLLGRWFGADVARVVSSDTPDREGPFDLTDPQIVINYRTGARKRSMTEIPVDRLRPGDILVGPDGAIDRTNNRVAKIGGFSGMWVIDFTNGTSTPPLGNGKVTVVREAAKYRGDLDRSVAFTVLLDVWPEFGSSADDGGATVTAFLNDWYEDPGTDMHAFAKQWVSGKTASKQAVQPDPNHYCPDIPPGGNLCDIGTCENCDAERARMFAAEDGDDWVHEGKTARKTAGNPHPVGTPAWFRWEYGEGDPASYGPSSGIPRDLFPEGGVPLHGDLTPEQEAWLHARPSSATPRRSSLHTARSLSEIAAEISGDWANVNYGAVPYLDAMRSLDSISDNYGMDDAKSIVLYFLSNATSWRGETAKRVKAELKGMLKGGKLAAENDEDEGAHTVRDPRNPRGLYGGDRNILLQDRALELHDEERREQLELEQLQRGGARSDYAHWNEDADYMWYQEEGRHVEEPPDPDEYYNDDRAADYPEDEEVDEDEEELYDDWSHGGDISPQEERRQMGITGSRQSLFGFGEPDKWGPVKWVPGTPIEDATPVDIWEDEHEKEGTLLTQAMPNPVDLGVKVGDIFYSSWGYDQTNVDFYEVTGLTGASVRVRPIGARIDSSSGYGQDYLMPVPGSFRGAEMTKRIQGTPGSGERIDRPYFRVDYGSGAWLWDGKPKYQTSSGWGH